jgi:hypothetical protein
LKFGYVSSGQTSSTVIQYWDIERKDGITFGAFIHLFNFNGISISPEIKYIEKGSTQTLIIEGIEEKGTIEQEFISVPILITYKFNQEFGNLFLKVGPRYDFFINSKDNFKLTDFGHIENQNTFGLDFSISYSLNSFKNINPIIEASFSYDIEEVSDHIKNNLFSINAGIIF